MIKYPKINLKNEGHIEVQDNDIENSKVEYNISMTDNCNNDDDSDWAEDSSEFEWSNTNFGNLTDFIKRLKA